MQAKQAETGGGDGMLRQEGEGRGELEGGGVL